jgi:hypothetical protein
MAGRAHIDLQKLRNKAQPRDAMNDIEDLHNGRQNLPAMTKPGKVDLNSQVLTDRIRDHGREIQLFMNSVLVSVAVANAAYVFALLLGSPISRLLWLPFVLASFGLVLVTFSGTFNTSLLIVSMPDWRDNTLPLLQAMMLFLMFSVLIPTGSALPLLTEWYAVVAAHALIGALWIKSLAGKTRATSYDVSLTAAVQSHLKLMRRSATAAALTGIFWCIVWVSVRWWLLPEQSPLLRFQGFIGVIALLLSIGVIIQIESDRRKFVRLITSENSVRSA